MRLVGINKDAPRPGRILEIPQEVVDTIIHKTLPEKPSGETHWSTRSMSKTVGVSRETVRRTWRAHRLKPPLISKFKISNEPCFAEKVRDVVGLYLNSPEKAVVLCVDEKTQIQALDRTQTILPIRPGFLESHTHDYRRNSIIELFAALDALTGTVLTEFHHHHRHQEFLMFFRTIDEKVDSDLDVHPVLDNLKTHKHELGNRWFQKHPRFHVHFVPTGSSWLNLVERWFGNLTEKRIRRGIFKSVRDSIKAIKKFLASHHENPHHFIWTAKADDILRKVAINRQLLVSAH